MILFSEPDDLALAAGIIIDFLEVSPFEESFLSDSRVSLAGMVDSGFE